LSISYWNLFGLFNKYIWYKTNKQWSRTHPKKRPYSSWQNEGGENRKAI